MFTLNNRLEQDTREITRLGLSRVLLMKDARYPWLILVPEKAELEEITDLSGQDQATLMGEISKASTVLQEHCAPDKINVGALGNIVRQLHIHIVARFEDDEAWPGPIWGQGSAIVYTQEQEDALVSRFASLFDTKV